MALGGVPLNSHDEKNKTRSGESRFVAQVEDLLNSFQLKRKMQNISKHLVAICCYGLLPSYILLAMRI